MNPEHREDGAVEPARVSTGIPQLDAILGGGIPRGSINIVTGTPGTGKTIFAEQMAFHNADGDRPILYLTTLSEPLAKVVTYLQGFTFYDEARLLAGVVYEDVGSRVATKGPSEVVERIRRAIREIGPKMIVVDSFKAIHDLASSASEMRRLITDLAGALSAYDATVLLIGEYAEDEISRMPEFAVADGILEFARRGHAKRDDRFVRVLKLRGSAYAEGLHSFTISRDGLRVFPRLVTPATPEHYDAASERIATGITGLDAILDGGLWRGNMVLIAGVSGSGKTTLGLQYVLEGARLGERGLFFNFQENPVQLGRSLAGLGVTQEQARSQGVSFRYVSPVELSIDRIVVELLRAVEEHGVRRVVIDALGDLALAAGDPQRFHDYFYSLCQQLIVHGVTAVMTLEVRPRGALRPNDLDIPFGSMVDAVIELDIDMTGVPRRTLRVVKARGIAHDMRLHEMRIDQGRASVTEPIEEA